MVSYKALNTTTERFFADWGDGVGDGDARQAAATRERLVADGGDGVADGDARQAAATRERLVADWGDGKWETTKSDRLGDGEVACRFTAWRIARYRNSCVVVIDAVAHAIIRKFNGWGANAVGN